MKKIKTLVILTYCKVKFYYPQKSHNYLLKINYCQNIRRKNITMIINFTIIIILHCNETIMTLQKVKILCQN